MKNAVLDMEANVALQKRKNKEISDFHADDVSSEQRASKEQAAHERFMQRRRNFIERNPNAVSHFERKAVFSDPQAVREQAALRQHELNVIKAKNAGEIAVAGKKSEGMANQGVAAARVNADMDKERIGAGLKQHELEMANRKDIAGIQSKTQMSIAELQNKAQLETARLQGENAVKTQAEANKGLLAQAELKEKLEREKLDAQIQKAIIGADSKLTGEQVKQRTTLIASAIRAGSQSGKDIATVLDELKETYKNDPNMLSALGTLGGSGKTSKSYSY